MKHFGWTFILYFLGFLFIRARAIPSWKSCSAHSDCQATGEYCRKTAGDCNHCALLTIDSYGLTDSIDSSKPAWCTDTITSADVTIASSSVLTFVKQSGFQNLDNLCPSFDACTIDCRKEYSVEKTLTQITLTSTFAETTDCVCDKLAFAEEKKEEATEETDLHWKSTSTNFGTSANSISLEQYSTSALHIIVYDNSSYDVDCYWAYSIGTISSPPPPPPSPSSPATTLTGLFGLISASVVAFVLV